MIERGDWTGVITGNKQHPRYRVRSTDGSNIVFEMNPSELVDLLGVIVALLSEREHGED